MNDQQQLLFRTLGPENLIKLPVYYRLMEPVRNSGNYFFAVESTFHNTTAYDSVPFYKPISKMQRSNDTK